MLLLHADGCDYNHVARHILFKKPAGDALSCYKKHLCNRRCCRLGPYCSLSIHIEHPHCCTNKLQADLDLHLISYNDLSASGPGLILLSWSPVTPVKSQLSIVFDAVQLSIMFDTSYHCIMISYSGRHN
jgi:hypothetical protein